MENRRLAATITHLAAGITGLVLHAAPASAEPPRCEPPPVPSCETAPPPVAATRGFRHRRSAFVSSLGRPNHRGRDLLLRPGDRQFAIGKLAYGVIDKDLEDEEVDVFVLRDCRGPWRRLGTALTSEEGDHAAVEGVPDTGGRVFVEIPRAEALGPGRHRIHLSVAGDGTGADLYLQVAPAGARIVLVDIDGTLTRRGAAEFGALLTGTTAEARPGAPAALGALAARGYVPVYLTGRPETLVGRTRHFLRRRGFPPGLVMTTTRKRGAIGRAAVEFKAAAIGRAILGRGYIPVFAFGDTPGDAAVYAAAEVPNRFSFGFADSHGGRRFDSYESLVAELSQAPCAVTPRR